MAATPREVVRFLAPYVGPSSSTSAIAAGMHTYRLVSLDSAAGGQYRIERGYRDGMSREAWATIVDFTRSDLIGLKLAVPRALLAKLIDAMLGVVA